MTPLNNKNVYDFSKGDPKVFEVFFLHYFPQVKNFISRLIQNEEDAEDLAQDIFAGLWKNRTLLGEVENMNAYLYRSAKNTVFRYIERHLLFKNYQEKSVWTEEILPPSRNQVEEEFRAHELELLIAIAVDKMPPQRKKIYKMSREAGMENEKIAAELGISKRTVENHLTQALADIRKLIDLFIFLFI